MYAPDRNRRWELKRYDFTDDDRQFAEKFIGWNDIDYGIERVDACRTREGELLLVELEDLNPYLSILELDPQTRDAFIDDLIHALNR